MSAESICDEQVARSVNGEVESESESDNPEQYVGVKNVTSEAGKLIVKKKWRAIKQRARREQARALAEKRFLSIKKNQQDP